MKYNNLSFYPFLFFLLTSYYMDGLGQVYSQSLSLFNQHTNELYIYICIYTHARRTTIVFVFILLKSDNRQHDQVYQIISHHN